jgi:uncharacterized protein (TIGR02145 family)
MRHLFTILLAALSLNAEGQINPNYNPDYDGDGEITVHDHLEFLSLYGTSWDAGDVILGCTYSIATDYNPMANMDDGSCTFPSYCDSDGNVLDECGVCGGDNSTCFTGCGDGVMHDGYDYNTVQIGGQCWFAENCRYLPEVSNSSSGNSTDPFYYVAGYGGTNVAAAMATSNYDTYGVLYNWPAVMTDDICPSGWHIPTEPEWQTLEMELGMTAAEVLSTAWRGTDQGSQLKSTAGWENCGNGTNSSGFNGLPGGYRYAGSGGGYNTVGSYNYLWVASESDSSVWIRLLGFDFDQVYRYDGGNDAAANLHLGMSARCIQD